MVYVVEDEAPILELVLYALNTQNIRARGFGLPSDFWKAIREEIPTAIVLDVMLPEENGLNVLRQLRQDPVTRGVPVMILSALGSEFEKVKGLDNGADDYLVKPFGIMELLARVRVMLRRKDKRFSGDIVTLDGLVICHSKRTATLFDEELVLTLKEFDLLYLMAGNPDKVFTREELFTHVWGYAYRHGESRTVDIHLNTLRQKLGIWGGRIKTIRGVGYKLLEDYPLPEQPAQ